MEYDSSDYTYTCEDDVCECVLIITSLADIFKYSSEETSFTDLLKDNLWAMFVLISFADLANLFQK